MEQQLVRNLQARQIDLERDIERLKELQDSVLGFGFGYVNSAIRKEIADREFYLNDIGSELGSEIN